MDGRPYYRKGIEGLSPRGPEAVEPDYYVGSIIWAVNRHLLVGSTDRTTPPEDPSDFLDPVSRTYSTGSILLFEVEKDGRVTERCLIDLLLNRVALEMPVDETWNAYALYLRPEVDDLICSQATLFADPDRQLVQADKQAACQIEAPIVRSGWRAPGDWLETPQVLSPATTGVTARAIRSFPLGEMHRRASYWLDHARSRLKGEHEHPGVREMASLVATLDERRPGRAGRQDSYYLPLAAEYAQLVSDGSRKPLVILAERHGLGYRFVRDHINAARDRGLLSGGTRGQFLGSGLTHKAHRLMKEAQNGLDP